jgi:hypothetical protein
MKRVVTFAIALTALVAVTPFDVAAQDRLWFGGNVGLGFGDVQYVDVSPIVGYSFTEKLHGGVSLTYRYRKDKRFVDDISTSDYGGSLFARYRVTRPIFLQAEYEYLDYEFVRFDGSTDRDQYDSVFGGVGFSTSTGGRASFFALALYNFTYSDSDPGPYDEPWVVRAGVAFGF